MKILWVNDEIDYLKPHIVPGKKITVSRPAITVVTSVDIFENENFDIVSWMKTIPA
jgi:hypothetical protein